jgi:SAM-dependent methyltransferase
MDLLQCSIKGRQFDAVVALNVLEHIEDDTAAISRMADLLKAGGIVVLEVPQGPMLYDLYDAYLRHFRRYSRKELTKKCIRSGLTPLRIGSLGFVPYAPFWVMKKLNRLRYGSRGEKAPRLEEFVRGQIKATADSKMLGLALFIESALFKKVSAPIGIRCTLVARAGEG